MTARVRAQKSFRDRYGQDPVALVRAPGRVNVIGEHTDYQGGWVLPAAIDREVWIALTPHARDEVTLASDDVPGVVHLALAAPVTTVAERWGAYVAGVAWALADAGYALGGWHGVLASDVPIGAGLSSSAAVELATARAFWVASGFSWDAMAMARAAQRAENERVGVQTGVMDQVASACGRGGHALLLDCRSLEVTPVRLPSDVQLVVLDTATRRELVGSAYDDRRRECEAAAKVLGVASLRDVTPVELDDRAHLLTPPQAARARHVVTENARTLQAAAAMHAGDAARLGALLNASHASLRDDFDVSSKAFDAITDAARSIEGCHGARLTGGGFAGCAVALVAPAALPRFADELLERYRAATGREGSVHPCVAVDGASAVDEGARP